MLYRCSKRQGLATLTTLSIWLTQRLGQLAHSLQPLLTLRLSGRPLLPQRLHEGNVSETTHSPSYTSLSLPRSYPLAHLVLMLQRGRGLLGLLPPGQRLRQPPL